MNALIESRHQTIQRLMQQIKDVLDYAQNMILLEIYCDCDREEFVSGTHAQHVVNHMDIHLNHIREKLSLSKYQFAADGDIS